MRHNHFNELTYRAEIDGLRAVAVSMVIVFHFFPTLLSNGYLGVDIFFVISGFLISQQLLKIRGRSTYEIIKDFYSRRIKRLFPALFLFLALTHIFIAQFFLASDLNNFENSLLSAYTFWSNFYFWRDGGYFGGADQLKPLLHIWSLSVEEQFYIFAPITILILKKISARVRYALLLGVMIITFLSFFLWVYLVNIGGQNPAFFLLPTRIWQFGIGAFIAISNHTIGRSNKHINLNSISFTFGLILILLGIFVKIGEQSQTLLITLGTAIFIYFSKNTNSILLNIFRTKILLFFGRISYSLYLYHWPIAVALNYYFIDRIPYLYSFCGIILSIVLGWISFTLIEKRFRF